MKTFLPSHCRVAFVALLFPTVAGVASSTSLLSDGATNANTTPLGRQLRQRGIPRPETRYIAWSRLDEALQTAAVTLLGYDSITWNDPGSALVEDESWSGLNETQRQGAATAMGIVDTTTFTSEEIWDCWINHYDDYDWAELATEGVQQYFVTLGWTDAAWNSLAPPPASDDEFWEGLTDAERDAALQICYDANLWNGVNLETINGIPETAAPTTAVPTLSPTISNMPTREDATRPPTSSPTSLPTSMPTATYVIPPYPPLRYTVFSALPQAVQDTLTSDVLGYTNFTWNTPGAEDVEDFLWDQLSDAQRSALAATPADGGLAMTPEVWNCYVNHYTSFDSWAEMKMSDANIQQFWAALGWSQATWEGLVEEAPESEDNAWADLTATEKDAAMALCYMEDTWNGESLLDYGTGAPVTTEEPTSSPNSAGEPTLSPMTPSAAASTLVMNACGIWTGIATSTVLLGFIGSIIL